MIFLLLLLIFLSPRLILFLVWLFDYARFSLVFAHQNFLIPLLGFIFVPWTTLAYLFNYNPLVGHLTAWGWFWVILALLVDLGSYGSSRYGRRRGPVDTEAE